MGSPEGQYNISGFWRHRALDLAGIVAADRLGRAATVRPNHQHESWHIKCLLPCNYAVEEAGGWVHVVVAAGNSNKPACGHLSLSNAAITVGATDQNDAERYSQLWIMRWHFLHQALASLLLILGCDAWTMTEHHGLSSCRWCRCLTPQEDPVYPSSANAFRRNTRDSWLVKDLGWNLLLYTGAINERAFTSLARRQLLQVECVASSQGRWVAWIHCSSRLLMTHGRLSLCETIRYDCSHFYGRVRGRVHKTCYHSGPYESGGPIVQN
jgi:hypothetical protein